MSFLPSYDIEERRKKKMKSDHRIIVLQPVDGERVRDQSGLISKSAFDGSNQLHAQFSHHTGMWRLNYDKGGLPGGLQVLFTSFPELLNHVRLYFYRRNVEVVDVVDVN